MTRDSWALNFPWKHAACKESMSDSLGLVDFAIGLVNSVFNLPDGRASNDFRGIRITYELWHQFCWSKSFWGLVEVTSGLVNASFSLPEWQAVKMIFFAPWLVTEYFMGHETMEQDFQAIEFSMILNWSQSISWAMKPYRGINSPWILQFISWIMNISLWCYFHWLWIRLAVCVLLSLTGHW